MRFLALFLTAGFGFFFYIIFLSQPTFWGSTMPNRHVVLLESFWPSENVDPTQIVSAGDWTMLQNLYSNLVELDGPDSVRPALAESWVQSPDGLQWDFKLRDNLKWSDGSHMTSADVAWSLRRSSLSTAHTKLSGFVEAIESEGDRMIKIRLKKLPKNFLVNLAFVDQSIVHSTAVSSEGFNWAAKSSGCFRLKSTNQKSIELLANPNFYGNEENPNRVESAELLRAAGSSDDFEMLKNAKVDAFQSGPGQLFGEQADLFANNYQILRGNPDFTFVLLFNRGLVGSGKLNKTQRGFLLRLISEIFSSANSQLELATGLRPNGLVGHVSLADYTNVIKTFPTRTDNAVQDIRIAVRSKHMERPYVTRLLRSLEAAGQSVKLIEYAERPKPNDLNFDLEIGFLGASEADPDSVWRYYNDYFLDRLHTDEQLDQAQFLQIESERDAAYQQFDLTALKSAYYIPLAYTRTFIFTKNHLKFDARVAADWGLQLCRLSIR